MKLDFQIPSVDQLFNLNETEHSELFREIRQPWDVLLRIEEYLRTNLRHEQNGQVHNQAVIQGDVYIGEGSIIEAGALICGPVRIGRNCRIGHGAILRNNLVVGDDCVIGHAVELKNSLLFNGCEVAHFNYIGDSILGAKVHLGAGAILSNYRLIRGNVRVHLEEKKIETGMDKLGALIGDRTEIGCNAVLLPGTIIGQDCVLYPNINFGGVLPAGRLVKNKNELEVVPREEDGD
ncbi:MAG: DapH/DapD/GlmU-related protein [Verrucomicrobiota bacterium]|nr:DapH/DapD/GlmU-related protein [Verrucomicrobiota bacterium]